MPQLAFLQSILLRPRPCPFILRETLQPLQTRPLVLPSSMEPLVFDPLLRTTLPPLASDQKRRGIPRNLPNTLTTLRLLLTPFLLLPFLVSPPPHPLPPFFFLLASLTDYLDGHLARSYNLHTAFGQFLDPVADKLLITFSLLSILTSLPSPSTTRFIPLYRTIVIISSAVIITREIAVSGLREWMARKKMEDKVKVSKGGKWKTTMQMISVFLLLLERAAPMRSMAFIGMIGMIILGIAASLTVASAYDYFVKAWDVLMNDESSQSEI